MARNSVFDDLGVSDLSYLLDPEVGDGAAPKEEKGAADRDAQCKEIEIGSLMSFEGHPFRVDTEDESFAQLVDSIKDNGLIYPILVRPRDGRYEIISGHRRVAACRAAGIRKVQAKVLELDDFSSVIYMVHSNFHREKILPSEKAKAYRMCMEAGRHNGRGGGETAETIGEREGDSKRTVFRFIRLSYLSEDLLGMLDAGKLQEKVGVELSYLSVEVQGFVTDFIEQYGVVPSYDQAAMLRLKYNKQDEMLSQDEVVGILADALKKKPPTSVSFKRKELAEYFEEGTDAEYMQDIIRKLLQKYKEGEVLL